jgi:hypothetical protein
MKRKALTCSEVQAFTNKQIELLTTFADQATYCDVREVVLY